MDGKNKAWTICIVALAIAVPAIVKVSTDYHQTLDEKVTKERIEAMNKGCSYIDTKYDHKVILCGKQQL